MKYSLVFLIIFVVAFLGLAGSVKALLCSPSSPCPVGQTCFPIGFGVCVAADCTAEANNCIENCAPAAQPGCSNGCNAAFLACDNAAPVTNDPAPGIGEGIGDGVGAGIGGTSSGFGVNLPNPLCPRGAGSANCINDFPTLIRRITDYILTIVGILATLMLVIAGILFVISGGSPDKTNQAKKMAIYAGIGLAIALAGKGLIGVIESVVS